MENRLPDSEVEIRIARCGKCNKVVIASVKHLMSKESHKEFADCVKVGCNVETIPLLEYRKMKDVQWCDTKCGDKK